MPLPGFLPTSDGPPTTAASLAKRWGPTILVAVLSAAAGFAWNAGRNTPPRPDSVAAMKAVGRAYPKALASAYAEAWLHGADALDAGRGVSEALGAVSDAWSAGRTALFDREIAPAFAAVVPEGRPDAEVSAADRAALAALWRGLAAGLTAAR